MKIQLDVRVVVGVFVLLLGFISIQAMKLTSAQAKVTQLEVAVVQLQGEIIPVKDEREVLRASLFEALGILQTSLETNERILVATLKYKSEVDSLRWVVLHERMSGYISSVNRQAPAREIAFNLLKSAVQYDLDPLLLLAQMEQESHFEVCARSSSNALGLMQLVKSTAKSLGVTRDKICDVGVNVEAGARYMARHLQTYNGDYRKAFRRYVGKKGDPLYEWRIEQRHKRIAVKVGVQTDTCRAVTLCSI